MIDSSRLRIIDEPHTRKIIPPFMSRLSSALIVFVWPPVMVVAQVIAARLPGWIDEIQKDIPAAAHLAGQRTVATSAAPQDFGRTILFVVAIVCAIVLLAGSIAAIHWYTDKNPSIQVDESAPAAPRKLAETAASVGLAPLTDDRVSQVPLSRFRRIRG